MLFCFQTGAGAVYHREAGKQPMDLVCSNYADESTKVRAESGPLSALKGNPVRPAHPSKLDSLEPTTFSRVHRASVL
jgi:hypothetical protein